jgi:hypothetical protein
MTSNRKIVEWTADSGLIIKTKPGLIEPALLDSIVIPKGVAWQLPIIYRDEQQQAVLDLSAGFTASWLIANAQRDGTALLTVTTITLAAEAPNITILVAANLTSGLSFYQGWGILTLTPTLGAATRLCEGLVRLR